MERITPLDLEGARLPKARKGYDVESVDAILRTAAGEIESLLKANQDLVQKSSADKRELESYRVRESTLSEAILLAQKTADETRANAHKQAELIIEAAKLESKELRASANDKIAELERNIEQLESAKKNFEAQFERILQDYLSGLSKSKALRSEVDRAA